MKEFRAAADIEVLLLLDSAKLKSSSSEDVSVQCGPWNSRKGTGEG
jgi:hypothetical protein